MVLERALGSVPLEATRAVTSQTGGMRTRAAFVGDACCFVVI
jgi:hypothetical protein